MEERLAFLADTLESAIEKLTLFVAGVAQITGFYRGCIFSEEPADRGRADKMVTLCRRPDLER